MPCIGRFDDLRPSGQDLNERHCLRESGEACGVRSSTTSIRRRRGDGREGKHQIGKEESDFDEAAFHQDWFQPI